MSQKLLSALKSLPTNRQRSDIISPNLCDDVIQRLKPSLAQYIGCTIIDINPGAGLFSRKLHEYLKPRNHVLLEPKQKHYEQFLKPLLDTPGSRYQIRDWPDEHRWDTKNFIQEGLMPNVDGSGGSPPTTEKPNNLALFIGNIANWKLSRPGRTNYASLKALDFARKARRSVGSGEPAPPRMLVWMSDTDKHPILPRTVNSRGRTSSILEAFCHVEEVVGSVSHTKVRREDALDMKSMQRVAARMRKNGVRVPKGRQSSTDVSAIDFSTTSRDWHQELRELEEGFKAQTLSQFVGLPPGPIKRRKRQVQQSDPERTPEFMRMITLQGVLNGQNSEIKKVGELLERQAEIDRLDREVAFGESNDGDKQRSKLEELDARIAELKEAQKRLSMKELYRFMFLDDDRRAFDMNPPLLMWDRRNAEPLIAQEDDFYYSRELALLDFQTNPSATTPATTTDQDMYYDMLASALLGHRGPTTIKHLDTVGPGAYQALVKGASSLQDPRKGGRRDIDSVRARTMTPDMIRELAVAWDEWAFKPPLADTLYQTDPVMVEFTRGGGPAARQRS